MKMRLFRLGVAAAAGIASAGCATSPALVNQANHGTSLVGQLEKELGEFRRVRQDAEKARLKAIAVQQKDVETLASAAAFDRQVRVAMGDEASVKMTDRLTGLADFIAKEEERKAQALARVDAQMAQLLKPLPSTAKASTAAQKAIAKMGEDLDWKTQLTEARAFYDEVEKSVHDNREKIRKAQQEADDTRANDAPAIAKED